MNNQVKAKKRVVVAYAKYKEKCPAGKLMYFNKTRKFPIKGLPENREKAIQQYINRTIRNPKSIYSRHDLFCYIETEKGKHLQTYYGGHIYDKKHASKFVLKHLDQGRELKKIYTTSGDEIDIEKAPWQLVNRYRPQRKKGNVRVYDMATREIVVRGGKKMEWQDGKRRP